MSKIDENCKNKDLTHHIASSKASMRGAGRSPDYVHTDNVEFHEEIHSSFDIAYVSSYTNLIKPTEAYTAAFYTVNNFTPDLWEWARSLTTATLECWQVIPCKGKDRLVIVPRVADVGYYSPWPGYRVCTSSVGRASNTILRLANFDLPCGSVDYFIKLTLTTPKSFAQKYFHEPEEGYAKLDEMFKAFYHKLRKKYCRDPREQMGLSRNIHPWSTRWPLASPHWHIHCMLLAAVWNPKKKKFIRFSPYLSHRTIKELWRDVLVDNGFWDKANFSLPVVKLNPVPLKNKAEFVHWMRYSSRRPSQDIANYYEDHPFWPDDISSNRWAGYLWDYHNPRINYGFLTRLATIIGAPLVEKVCPVCAGEVKESRIISNQEMLQLISAGLRLYLFNPRRKKHLLQTKEEAHFWIARMAQ